MTFVDFLTQAKKKTFWNDTRVLCFYGDQYPLFFFRQVINALREKEIATISSLTVDNRRQLWETLQQCFLGETSFYWLGNVVESIKKSKKKSEPDLVEVLSHYRGPHSIAFFVPREHKLSVSCKKRMTVVDLPARLPFIDVEKLFSFFGVKVTKEKRMMLKEIVGQAGAISLDVICMMMSYLAVTSVRQVDSLQQNLVALIEPELSLQSLAQALFTKQKKKFFTLWAQRQNEYTMPFWVAFWSEQFWRAYHVVTFLKQSNFPAARRFSFRLPPSFIRNDWRHCSSKTLKAGYKMLYDIDFAFKTGSTFCSLDLFYSNYFLNTFTGNGDYA